MDEALGALCATPLVVLVGPTAVGKSDLAIALAQRLGTEIVSADSMQVYRYFDIGTGKVPVAERMGIVHHLIDVLDPEQPFSVSDFARLADQAITQVTAGGTLPLVVGGSPLYLRVLLRGLCPTPAQDPVLRQQHLSLREQYGLAALYQRLEQVDPQAAGQIHPHDFVRISRALEVFEQTGVPLSSLQQQHRFAHVRYHALMVGLRRDPQDLRHRIDARVDTMIAAGWLDEVRALRSRGYAQAHPMGALGYSQLNAHLAGELDLAEAIRQTKRETWRFSRRQRGWFARESVHWFDAQQDVEPLTQAIQTQIRAQFPAHAGATR